MIDPGIVAALVNPAESRLLALKLKPLLPKAKKHLLDDLLGHITPSDQPERLAQSGPPHLAVESLDAHFVVTDH
jgi:hypothetical protein